MNFFQQQEEARKKTKFLILYFIFGVIGTVMSVYLAIMFLIFNERLQKSWWDEQIFLPVASTTLLIIAIGSIAKLIELSQGGGAVARALGGVKINPYTQNFEEKRLLNIVNEISIASGVPAPEIYVLNEEDGINAFAAGRTTANAAIGVTRGALKNLNRDELQGVIAHEFSHILNGDMRLNTNLIATISGILAISSIGYFILRMRTRGKNAGQIKLIGLVLLIIGCCGAFFARIIQAAISRQREFLADASAVQFTRNPYGIAGALRKIARIIAGSVVRSPSTSETAHLFFSNPLSGFLGALFATHPPIEERIKAIEGTQVYIPEPTEETARDSLQSYMTSSFAGTKPSNIQKIKSDSLISSAGTLNKEQIDYSERLISSYPQEILSATENTYSSICLVYALLLDANDENIRKKQITELAHYVAPQMLKEVLNLWEFVKNLERQYKLPLVHLSMSALKEMSLQQFLNFEKALELLIKCDYQIDLFEFTITKIVKRNLEPRYRKVRKIKPVYSSLESVKEDCKVLLSAVAWTGSGDQNVAQKAFNYGMAFLNFSNEPILPLNQCGIDSIDRALNNALLLKPTLRERLLKACSISASEDGYITAYEAELIRAIADALECPIPVVVFESV